MCAHVTVYICVRVLCIAKETSRMVPEIVTIEPMVSMQRLYDSDSSAYNAPSNVRNQIRTFIFTMHIVNRRLAKDAFPV